MNETSVTPVADTQKPLVVACGIIWQGNRFLAAMRPPGSRYADWWEFPGGKVEPGESPAQAIVRELAEELSITAHDPLFWCTVNHQYPDLAVELHFFHIRHFDGTPRPNDGQGLCWVTPVEALTLRFLEPDMPLLHALVKESL